MNNHELGGVNGCFPELMLWRQSPLAGFDSARTGERAFHFLHGNGFCGRTLEPLAKALGAASDHYMFTDLPGHGAAAGESSRESGGESYFSVQPDWNAMADAVADSIARRATTPVTAIGHSMGGVVTLLAAARCPELFSEVVLLDPVLFGAEVLLYQRLMRKTGLWQRTGLVKSVSARRASWPDKQSLAEDLRRKSLYRSWSDEAFDAFVEYGTSDRDGCRTLACAPQWEASIFGSYPRGLWRAVRTVDVPVGIIVASESYPFIRPAVKRAVRKNSNIRQFDYEGGHCFPMDAPEHAAGVINGVIAELNAR